MPDFTPGVDIAGGSASSSPDGDNDSTLRAKQAFVKPTKALPDR